MLSFSVQQSWFLVFCWTHLLVIKYYKMFLFVSGDWKFSIVCTWPYRSSECVAYWLWQDYTATSRPDPKPSHKVGCGKQRGWLFVWFGQSDRDIFSTEQQLTSISYLQGLLPNGYLKDVFHLLFIILSLCVAADRKTIIV